MTSTRKIALVTGGSRGPGRNTVRHLARNGIDAVFTYRKSRSEAAIVVAEVEALGGRAAALQLDTADTTGLCGVHPATRERCERQLEP